MKKSLAFFAISLLKIGSAQNYMIEFDQFYSIAGVLTNTSYVEAGIAGAFEAGQSSNVYYSIESFPTALLSNNSLGSLPDNLIPISFSVKNNFPNPFNSRTILNFTIPSPDITTIKIYNINGQLINTLFSGKLTEGKHSILWNGYDQSGKPVSSGLYMYKIQSGKHSGIKKMTLLK